MKRATVSFTEEDLKRLERLKKTLELSSVSQTLSALIKLTDDLRGQMQEGKEVVITDRSGHEKSLYIHGFERHHQV